MHHHVNIRFLFLLLVALSFVDNLVAITLLVKNGHVPDLELQESSMARLLHGQVVDCVAYTHSGLETDLNCLKVIY